MMPSTIAAWAAYCMLATVKDLPQDTVSAKLYYKGKEVADMKHGGYCPHGRLIPRCRAVYLEAIPGSLNYWLLEVRTASGRTYTSSREVALPNRPMIPQRHVRRVCDLWNRQHPPVTP